VELYAVYAVAVADFVFSDRCPCIFLVQQAFRSIAGTCLFDIATADESFYRAGPLSSPDALSQLLLFAAFYRIWFDKKYLVTVLLLTLSLFVRPDNLLTVLVFLSLMKVWPGPKISTTAYALSVLLAVASCFAVNYFFEPRFWWFRRTNSQQTFLYLQSLQGYRDQVMIYLSNLTQSLVLPVVLTGAAVYFRNGKRFSRRALYFLRAVLMVVLIRFIIFPYTEERFMSSFYLCSLLILLEELFRGPVERNTA